VKGPIQDLNRIWRCQSRIFWT